MTYDFELLASGFGTIEGPTVDAEGTLYFSDVFQGGVFRLAADGGVTTVVPKRKGVAGITLHRDGGIIVSGRDLSHVKDGESRTVLRPDALPERGGAPVTGFQDMTADAAGRLFAGTVRTNEDRHQVPGELVMIDTDGTVTLPYHIAHPNGITFSAGEQMLFHADSFRRSLLVSRVDDSGVPRLEREISTLDCPGVPDGMASDEEGLIWIAFYDGGQIVRMSPNGEVVERIPAPAREVTNLCFGGRDGRELYVTTGNNDADPGLGGCVFRARTPIPGKIAPSATV
jgi:gluconolactonase